MEACGVGMTERPKTCVSVGWIPEISILPIYLVNSKNLVVSVLPSVSYEVLMVRCHLTPDKGLDGVMWCKHDRTAQNMCISQVDPNRTDYADHPHAKWQNV